MRKKIINLLTLICFFLPAFGQEVAESIQIGYCCGENGDMGDITSSNAKTLSAGILIPSGMTESLIGNRVESVRVYLPSKLNVTSLTAWLRSSLDGENIAEGTVKAKQLEKGWNEIQFETPYELNDNEPFYIGYTFDQKSRAYAITCTGFYVDGGLFYRFDDGEWETESKYGNLCVEGVVKGDKLPMYDLELDYVSLPPVYYSGDKLNVKLRVTNHAAATVTGFTLSYSIPDILSESTHVECNLSAGKSVDINLELPVIDVPEGEVMTMDFTISALDEGDDEANGNNSQSVQLNTANNNFKKVVLVEEFTTEQCGNCPGAAPKVYGAVDRFNEEHPGSVMIMCHHAGFYTDFLTSKFDESYLMLYGGGSYAPAAMVDRYAPDYGAPVFGISSEEQIYNKIAEAYNRPVSYSLEAVADFDETTSKLTVNVSGSRTVESDITPTRISVAVVENNIPMRFQAGATGEYIHQHAMRTANSAWGDVIDWNGYNFNYSCTLDIDADWKQQDLDILVFINQYNQDDEGQCYVENTRKLDFPNQSSVKSLTDNGGKPQLRVIDGNISVGAPYQIEGVWTLSGTQATANNLTPGLYIVKLTDGYKTVAQKVVVK